jgi:hypothetical protein
VTRHNEITVRFCWGSQYRSVFSETAVSGLGMLFLPDVFLTQLRPG